VTCINHEVPVRLQAYPTLPYFFHRSYIQAFSPELCYQTVVNFIREGNRSWRDELLDKVFRSIDPKTGIKRIAENKNKWQKIVLHLSKYNNKWERLIIKLLLLLSS
jgi:hypothetical protein